MAFSTRFIATRVALILGLTVAVSPASFAQEESLNFWKGASSNNPNVKFPDLKLELVLAKKQFAQGEEIPVTMRYSNNEKVPFKVLLVNYDRSGRIVDFGFSGTDDAGQPVRDPFIFHGGIMGGLRSSKTLGPGQIFEQIATANEWLAFDKPGIYQLTAGSVIISVPGDNDKVAEYAVPLTSSPIEIEITSPDEAKRSQALEAATKALNMDEEKRATLPASLSAYEREQKAGPGAQPEMRTLRWLIDPRAIPTQVRALELGNSESNEAYRGLAAYPDLALVRAALVARLKNGEPLTEGVWYFKDLLRRSSATKKDPPLQTVLSPQDEALFQLPLRASFTRNSKAHNTLNAARDAALLLQTDPKAPAEPAVWHQFFQGSASLSDDKKWPAALLLFQEKENHKTYPLELADLKLAVRSPQGNESLRSAAVIALTARGDTSSQLLLAQDIVSPHPRFSGAAHATLGKYQQRAIALKLLSLLKASDDSSPFAKDEIATRICRFGDGATTSELISAARWAMLHYPYSQAQLIEAVALRDPGKALTLLNESQANKPAWEYSDGRLGVLVRLNTPNARVQVRRFLEQKNQDFVFALLDQIDSSARDSERSHDYSEGGKRLRAPREMAESLVPEIARIYFHSPSLKMRQEAKNALMTITGLYASTVDSDPKATKVWRTNLKEWWAKNSKRLKREDVSLAEVD